MAQSATTVTPPNPTPPTNFSCTGATPPNPPNYTKNTYNDPKNWGAANPKDFPPPFFDDGTGGSIVVFAANTAALASGSGATAGGTEGTYPGTGTSISGGGAVPASTSVAAEGAGTEVLVTQTYAASVCVPGSAASYLPTGQTPAWAAGDAGGPLRTTSDLGSFTGVANSPNAQHASSLSPAAAATITGLVPPTTASGGGTFALTVNGTGFTRQSVVYVNGIAQTTVFVNSTQLTVAAAPKKASAGTLPVTVVTAGTVTTAATNMTFS